ncbi:MAG: hypothetical protein N4A40_12940 [Tissierellales bacterium]|jgi:hypothetical protein|nr:hypothetical protein [Tissierellales bacterium]
MKAKKQRYAEILVNILEDLSGKKVERLSSYSDDEILKLKRQIKFYENNLIKYFLGRDTKLIEIPFLRFVENYIEVSNLDADPIFNSAKLVTNEEVLEISGNIVVKSLGHGLVLHDNYGALFSLVKSAIDSKKRINLVKDGECQRFYLECTEEEKEELVEVVNYINYILLSTGNKIAVKLDGSYDVNIFKKVFRIIELEAIENHKYLVDQGDSMVRKAIDILQNLSKLNKPIVKVKYDK